jgi:hypothetical protein
LERNRQSARLSRRRKKDYLHMLESRLLCVQHDLHRARLEHVCGATAELDAQRALLLAAMEPVASLQAVTADQEAELQGAPPARHKIGAPAAFCALDLTRESAPLPHTHTHTDAANQLVDRYGPNCPERCAARDFLFEVLRRLLLPPHLKFLLWLTHAGLAEESAESGGSGGGGGGGGGGGKPPSALWAQLAAELGLSPEAAGKLRLKLRSTLFARDLPLEAWRLGAAAAYVQQLRAVVSLSAARAQAQLQAVRAILTPAQLIRFLAWANDNPAIADTVMPA